MSNQIVYVRLKWVDSFNALDSAVRNCFASYPMDSSITRILQSKTIERRRYLLPPVSTGGKLLLLY
ncbi:MAG: hypothetical protein ABI729_05480 [Chitinophagales bacterium]